jgi:hypothetical protein
VLTTNLIAQIAELETDLRAARRAQGAVTQRRQHTPGLDPDLFKRVLMLVHPDKHDNSTLAAKVSRNCSDLRSPNHESPPQYKKWAPFTNPKGTKP